MPIRRWGGTVATAAVLVSVLSAQTPGPAAPRAALPEASGSGARRGQTLYEDVYRCYACHGYTGETGLPRLVPMTRTREGFIAYLRKPPAPAMPAFIDVAEQDLTDVYAYIRSLRPVSPAVEDVPMLKDLLQRIADRSP